KKAEDEIKAKKAANEEVPEELEKAAADAEAERTTANGEWRRNSLLGRTGVALEPVFRPLGWDWRIGMAAIASFPAREVMVGTLGLIYNQGKGDSGDAKYRQTLGEALREANFTAPVALSVMVFFALCCQCASTLAVIRRETNSWRWPVLTFVYMTVLAYLGALLTYQLGSLFL